MTLEAPAHIAVRQKQHQVVKVIAEAHGIPADGQSSLQWPIILALLFAYAADPDQRDKSGISPRQAAGLNEHLIDLFRKYDKGGAEAFEDPPGLWVRQADTITAAYRCPKCPLRSQPAHDVDGIHQAPPITSTRRPLSHSARPRPPAGVYGIKQHFMTCNAILATVRISRR
eukprot:scaffold296719_cov48-Prasinocladus_malaysianus.AAC.1